MIARLTYTRRPLWVKLLQPLVVLNLRWALSSAQAYADHARVGGVFSLAELARLDRNIGPIRTALHWWEGL